MNYIKKFIAIISIILGSTIFVCTAVADIFIGSAYSDLKDAYKSMTAELALFKDGSFDSYEILDSSSLKVDGITYYNFERSWKVAFSPFRDQVWSLVYRRNIENTERFEYRDGTIRVAKGGFDEVYYVSSGSYLETFVLPPIFQLEDRERAFDAIFGNYAELVQVEDFADKRIYSVNLSGVQIPLMVDVALSGTIRLMTIAHPLDDTFPHPASAMYLQSISLNVIENEFGMLESWLLTMTASAIDHNGVTRIYTTEESFQIVGINSTILERPVLEGREVSFWDESVRGYFYDK